jgi:hypothetical protein
VTHTREGAQVTSTDQQRGPEQRAEAGHRFDDRCLRVLMEGLSDLGIEALEALVQHKDVRGELGDDARGEIVAGQHRHLGAGRGDGSSGKVGRVAYFALAQPCGQPGGADAADPLWAGRDAITSMITTLPAELRRSLTSGSTRTGTG